MKNNEAYDLWSRTYDSMSNKTRDLEAVAFRKLLSKINFSKVIELGCGTGKNTAWLAKRADWVTAVDFSERMISEARNKIQEQNIDLVTADIRRPWRFTNKKVDLITCSLVLEHVEGINTVFRQTNLHLRNSGFFYIGELHPFKQYEGSRARFETSSGIHTLECFTHHISDYVTASEQNGFKIYSITEWFDKENKAVPRIIAFLFQKNTS